MYLDFINIVARQIAPELPPEYKEVQYVNTNGANAIRFTSPNSANNNFPLKNIYVKIGIKKTDAATGEQGFLGSTGAYELYLNNSKIYSYYSAISLISPTNGSTVDTNNKIDVIAFISQTGQPIQFGQYDLGRYIFYGDLYYAQIVDGASGRYLLDAVPCRRVADDVAGFYDRVTGLFYHNVGGGSFIAGPDK